jgi:hypothetical protein
MERLPRARECTRTPTAAAIIGGQRRNVPKGFPGSFRLYLDESSRQVSSQLPCLARRFGAMPTFGFKDSEKYPVSWFPGPGAFEAASQPCDDSHAGEIQVAVKGPPTAPAPPRTRGEIGSPVALDPCDQKI